MKVSQCENGITLNQKRYATKIIDDAGMISCNPAHSPMEIGLKLSKFEGEREIDATEYTKSNGCLRYLLHTRPNLSFSVGVLSRYMQCLKESHGIAMKQVLRYLQGSSSYKIVFERMSQKFLDFWDIVTVAIYAMLMTERAQLGTSSTLLTALLHGARRNRTQWHCPHVRLNLWQGHKPQERQFGFKIS